jgi:hypothetical protein
MATSQCDNTAHRTAVNVAEGVRQVAVTPAATQAAIIAPRSRSFVRASPARKRTASRRLITLKR